MSSISQKLRVLLSNNCMTQAYLAVKLHVSESTVQKWIVGKNQIGLEDLISICKLFNISIDDMVNDDFEIFEYIEIDRYLPNSIYSLSAPLQDSIHIIIDAGLSKNALLHRFQNATGVECSAIYQGKLEVLWHYREHEINMIKYWNEIYSK